MGLNLQTFQRRALTAIIFVVVMLGGLLWNMWSFIILCTLIAAGCIYEFIKIGKKIPVPNRSFFMMVGSLFILMSLLLYVNFGLRTTQITSVFDQLFYQPLLPCLILFSLWINDTMAYLIGSLIGKTQLSKISPNKTWEGTIGGIITSILLVGFLFPFISFDAFTNPGEQQPFILSQSSYFIIAGICAVFGTMGDLAESKLKRIAGIKDSGTFMPGHGGFLDRFDSLLLAVPAVGVYLQIMLM